MVDRAIRRATPHPTAGGNAKPPFQSFSPSVLQSFSPSVILPADDEAASFSARLDDALLSEIRRGLSEHDVTLELPRFSFESENRLKAPLKALGYDVAIRWRR